MKNANRRDGQEQNALIALTAISGVRSASNKFEILKLTRQMHRCEPIKFKK